MRREPADQAAGRACAVSQAWTSALTWLRQSAAALAPARATAASRAESANWWRPAPGAPPLIWRHAARQAAASLAVIARASSLTWFLRALRNSSDFGAAAGAGPPAASSLIIRN